MAENAASNRGARFGFWRWHGPDDVLLLICLAAGFLGPYFFGKSGLAMASFIAVVLCGGLAWEAYHGSNLDNWGRSMAWRLRIGAVVIGGWLFLAAHSPAVRITAVTVFAALYILSERAVWRRMRSA